MTSQELAKIRNTFIDERQDSMLKTASQLEIRLFDLIIERFVELFEQSQGNIIFNQKNTNATTAIEKIYDEFIKIEGTRFITQFVDDIQKITDLNIQYNESIADRVKDFQKIADRVEDLMRFRLGITAAGGLKPDGFIDSFLQDTAIKTKIRTQLLGSVTRNLPVKDFIRDLRLVVTGDDNAPGAIETRFKEVLFDVYQQHDRATSKLFANQLGLRAFTYAGGLIETSRIFCIEKNNKTFTVDEADQWINDPNLPKTKAERESGVVVNYDPIIDCGRWRCRHHVNFVSDKRAIQLRPDLEDNF